MLTNICSELRQHYFGVFLLWMADTSNIATGVSTVQISHIYVRNFKNSEENFLKAIDAKLHNEVVGHCELHVETTSQ